MIGSVWKKIAKTRKRLDRLDRGILPEGMDDPRTFFENRNIP